MKRYFLPLLSLVAFTVSAQHIDQAEAQLIAADFFCLQSHGGPSKAPSNVTPLLAYTAQTNGTPDFFVFNRGENLPGYVIVNSAPDAETSILGYSTSNTFDAEAIPDALRWWLSQYQASGVAKLPARAGASRHDVEPLVKTKWNQDTPFNNAIPRYASGYAPFVTGCTSTAMAQLMKFHNYPSRGIGSNSYGVTYGASKTITYSADFGATNYDWANMLDDYSHGYTDAQANAVATLMYHAGVSEWTIYNWTENGGSSADDRHAAQGLINNFGYDKSMRRGVRKYYTDAEWDEIIYNELAEGRPLMYSGSSDAGGHTFVCDGYDAERHLFHINWGWGGYCDDYFALIGAKALTPNGTGIGGGAAGSSYTIDQTINYNIRPDQGGKAPIQVALLGGGELSTTAGGSAIASFSVNRAKSGADYQLYYTMSPQNDGFADATFEFGVVLRNTIDGFIYGSTYGTADALPSGNYYVVSKEDQTPYIYNASFSTSVAPYNGTYEVLPGYRENASGPWQVMNYDRSMPVPTITITGGTDAQPVDLPFDISGTQVEVGKTLTISHNPYYTGTVTYTTSNPAVATVASDGTIIGRGVGTVTITASSTADTHFKATTKAFTISVLTHIMLNVDVDMEKTTLMVGDNTRITLTDGYDGTPVYTVSPTGIVSVTANGVVTALSEGEATISVNVPATADYNATSKVFHVTVSNKPELKNEFCFEGYPVIGHNGIVTDPTELVLHMPIINNSGAGIDELRFYIKGVFDKHVVTFTLGYGAPIPSGYKEDYTYDFSTKYSDEFTPGRVYTLQFFLDSGCTRPMNVADYQFYYSGPNPTVGSLTRLVDSAQKGSGTPKLIRSLTNVVLNK